MLTRKAIRYSENIHPIGDSPLKSSAQRTFAPLQKSRRNHRSYVWTESLSSMATCRRKSFPGQFEHLSHMWLFTLEMIGAAQLRVATEIAPKWPFLCVNRIPIQYGYVPAQKLSGTVWTSIPYVTLHFRDDRRSAASCRYRNRAEMTVLTCEQKRYPVWLRAGAKTIRYNVNIS